MTKIKTLANNTGSEPLPVFFSQCFNVSHRDENNFSHVV